jgi:putative endonuclease
MATLSHNRGKWGEKVAIWYLRKKGYKIITTNYYTRFGEIDIIIKDNGGFVFVEVKTRLENNYGLPEQSVDIQKQKKLKKVISAYIGLNQIENFRVDVVSISRGSNQNSVKIRHHKAVTGII